MSRIRELIHDRGAHASRTIVLLPYAHLLQFAREAWAADAGSGFAPRFETTQTWSQARVFESDGISGDMGRDLLAARELLERAGLKSQADLLAARLVETASQLARAAAAIAPFRRAAWAAQARGAISATLQAAPLALESAVASIALEWAAASTYATDALFEAAAFDGMDLLVVLRGVQADPLADALREHAGDKSAVFDLAADAPSGEIQLHEASDPADEAERAAACVIRHINAGRVPVALGAVDRVLTRRIHAMLFAHGVGVRDETGWKLSTTRRAADVMLALRASAWNASSDEVLDWLKNAPAARPFAVQSLERQLRRAGFVREWRAFRLDEAKEGGLKDLLGDVAAWRGRMEGAKTIAEWLASLRKLLQDAGQWQPLVRDAAGSMLVSSLHLGESDADEAGELPQAHRRWTLAEFTAWVNETVESKNFKPEPAAQEQVVILPVGQVAGRAFAALVMPGCDEMRLVPSPEPAGLWTPSQRELLGLSSRETMEAETREGWRQALQTPQCDLLWRRSDESGEPLLPGTLVQLLQLEQRLPLAPDARVPSQVDPRPTVRPTATGHLLPITQLSPTAYADLRTCPYRFFSMRQLGLQEADEIDAEVDKRDFGNWLHRVLSVFHVSLQRDGLPAGRTRSQLLDEAAQQVTRAMRLDEGEFLPFAAAWPRAREGYLEWLARHEATERATFVESEGEHVVELGSLKLMGRIDRIDKLADGSLMVMDYKTESLSASKERVKDPSEDTQLAFYAALLHDDTLRAAYVNVGERGQTRTVEQVAIVDARDMLVEGILADVERIKAGEQLPALGEGRACDFCGARGLCRRDFW